MANQLDSVTVIERYQKVQERLQRLFGIVDMDEFLHATDDILVEKFIKMQLNKPLDYTASDKALIQKSKAELEAQQAKLKTVLDSKRPFISNPYQRGFVLTVAVSQNRAYAFAPCYENETPVLINAPIRTHISSFFRAFANTIDPDGNLLKLYERGALHFNAWEVSDETDIYQFALEKCSLDQSVSNIEQLAEKNVYKNTEILYNIWYDKIESITGPVSETVSKKKSIISTKKAKSKVEGSESESGNSDVSTSQDSVENTEEAKKVDQKTLSNKHESSETGTIQRIKIKSLISRNDFLQTIDIMKQLLPLTTKHSLIKQQDDYGAEKKLIDELFQKYHDSVVYPITCAKGNTEKIIYTPRAYPSLIPEASIKQLCRATDFLEKFPRAKEDLQTYLNNWELTSLNILTNGTIEFTSELHRRLEDEKKNIINDLPEPSELSDVDSKKLEEIAISNIEQFCVYDVLLQTYFGRVADSVPHTKLSKGSIYRKISISIDKPKRKRAQKKN